MEKMCDVYTVVSMLLEKYNDLDSVVVRHSYATLEQARQAIIDECKDFIEEHLDDEDDETVEQRLARSLVWGDHNDALFGDQIQYQVLHSKLHA